MVRVFVRHSVASNVRPTGFLDSDDAVDYPHPQVGLLVVTRTGWTFVLSLLTAVILACIVPVADQPGTSFNEADTPVNQAAVIAPTRIARPGEMTTLLPAFRVTSNQGMKRLLVEPKSLPMCGDSPPLRSLLCTFLI